METVIRMNFVWAENVCPLHRYHPHPLRDVLGIAVRMTIAGDPRCARTGRAVVRPGTLRVDRAEDRVTVDVHRTVTAEDLRFARTVYVDGQFGTLRVDLEGRAAPVAVVAEVEEVAVVAVEWRSRRRS